MKISFDFDSTLDKKEIQEFALDCIGNDIEVWVVTSRLEYSRYTVHGEYPSGYNSDLFRVCKELGIDKDRVHFTNMGVKSDFFTKNDFIFHLDDDSVEVGFINKETNTTAIDHLKDSDWKEKCMELIYLAIERPKLKKEILSWNFDEYIDWLSYPYVTKEDLLLAKKAFRTLDMPKDYVEIIDIKLKNYGDDSRENKQ